MFLSPSVGRCGGQLFLVNESRSPGEWVSRRFLSDMLLARHVRSGGQPQSRKNEGKMRLLEAGNLLECEDAPMPSYIKYM